MTFNDTERINGCIHGKHETVTSLDGQWLAENRCTFWAFAVHSV